MRIAGTAIKASSAAAATRKAALIGLVIAYLTERKLVRLSGGLALLATAPLVIPGMVFAVGLFAAYSKGPIVLYGTEYWDQVLSFEPMIRFGTISPEDVNLFYRTDSIDEAYDFVVRELETHALKRGPQPDPIATE